MNDGRRRMMKSKGAVAVAKGKKDRRRRNPGDVPAGPARGIQPGRSLVGTENPDDLEDMEIGAIPGVPASPPPGQRQRDGERQGPHRRRPQSRRGRLP